MEYITVSAKITRVEFTALKAYCERRGITTSTLLRDLLKKELDSPLPAHISGRNRIIYNSETDNFSWDLVLDNDEIVPFVENIPKEYIEDLAKALEEGIRQRNAALRKAKKASVAVPSSFIKGGKTCKE